MMVLFELSQMWGLYLLLLLIWFLWGKWHLRGTNMLIQSGDAKCTRGDTWCCKDRKIKVTFVIWMVKSWRGTMIAKWRKKWSFLMLWKCWEILSLEGEFVHFQINWRIFLFWLKGENYRVSSQKIRCMHIRNWIFIIKI